MSWLSKLFRRAPAAPANTSAVVYTSADVFDLVGYPAYVGSTHVAQVRAAALPGLYSTFRDELFRLGIVRWNERFDCNQFAALYIALANARFYAANFHSDTPAQSLALAEYWYRPGAGRVSHAVVLALTDRGSLFIEPQTGNLLRLTPNEEASRYLVKF